MGIIDIFRGARRGGKPPLLPRSQSSAAVPLLAMDARAEPRGLDRLVQAMLEDDMVTFALGVLKSNLISSSVTVSADGTDGESHPRAERLAEAMQETWETHVPSMTECIEWGRVAFEKIEKWDDDREITTFKLIALPWQNTTLRLEDDGSFGGIIVRADKAQGEVPLPPPRAWWLALDATALEPAGRSRFRSATRRAWEKKARAEELHAQFLKRYAIPRAVSHTPERITTETGEDHDVFTDLGAKWDAIMGGGLLMFPNDRDENGNYLWDLTEMPFSPASQSFIETAINTAGVQILRSLGIPEKTVIEGESVGSYAMVSQQMIVLFATIEGILRQIVDSYQLYVVDKAVELNFPAGERPNLKVTFPRLSNRPDGATEQILTALAANPQFVDVVMGGGVDLRRILETAGLPVTDDLERVAGEVMRRLQATAAQGPPPRPF